jgi:hypothetical protein
MDPAEGWFPKHKTFAFEEGTSSIPTDGGNYMGYNQANGMMYTRYSSGEIAEINPATGTARVIYKTPHAGTSIGIDVDPTHPNMLYIAGYNSQQMAHGIWRLDITNPAATWERLNAPTGSGHRDGHISQALFNTPYGIKFDQTGIAYISDLNNSCIRRYDPTTGMVSTVLGIPGKAGFENGGPEIALFNQPSAIGVNMDGDIYVADRSNRRVRKLAIE